MDASFYFLGAALAALPVLAWDCWRWGITPTPSLGAARRRCLQLMEAQAPAGVVAELGCGLGGMARAMARVLPHARVWAVEGSWLVYGVCRVLGCMQRRDIRWQRADFMGLDLSGCEGVFCYLYPGAMTKLAPKLQRELPEGAWVVSHAFALPGWPAQTVVRGGDLFRTPVYFYRVNRAASPP